MRLRVVFVLLLSTSLIAGCKPNPAPVPPAPKTVAAADGAISGSNATVAAQVSARPPAKNASSATAYNFFFRS